MAFPDLYPVGKCKSKPSPSWCTHKETNPAHVSNPQAAEVRRNPGGSRSQMSSAEKAMMPGLTMRFS